MYYHEFCVKTIYSIFKNMDITKEQHENAVYKYAIVGGLIGQYAETYILDGVEFKFWEPDFHKEQFRGRKIWYNLFSSCAADKLSSEIEKGNIKPIKKNKTAPFFEHLEPKNITHKKIIKLKENGDFTENDVKLILEQSKLIMLTYKQKELLDNKPKNKFDEKDEKIIKNWLEKGKITEKNAIEAIASMKDNNGYINTNANGTSYARFAHIFRWGIRDFCYKGKIYSGDEAIEGFKLYIDNGSHECI